MELYKIGSKGAVVKQIQKAVGCYPDGIFGKLTREAVMVFQQEHNLKVDGIVGPATLALLIPSCLKKSRRKITEIIVHCSATPEGRDYTIEQCRKDHLARGFSDVGYHYMIYRDGSVHDGRSVDYGGAHCSGHNARSIGVCYVGGLENKNVPYNQLKAKDTRTEEQRASLLSLLMDLRKLYPEALIMGHRDTSPDLNGDGIVEPWEWVKECPSFDAMKEYAKV